MHIGITAPSSSISIEALYARYRNRIVVPDEDTARIYGAIYAELTATGRIMQQNDVWIAALARQYDLTLATPASNFARISGLTVDIF